jgi:hypothetical protein
MSEETQPQQPQQPKQESEQPLTPNSSEQTEQGASPEQSTSPEFENLGGKIPENAVIPGEAPPDNKPKFEVIPFTDAEVVTGAAFIAMFGGERMEMFTTEQEKEAFAKGFMSIAPLTLKSLKLGEALAEYGIGKNSMPGIGQVEAMPAWLRIGLGGVAIGIGTYAGGMAVNAQRVRENTKTVEAEGRVKNEA